MKAHCTKNKTTTQIMKVVNEVASKRLPFGNSEFVSNHQFRRVWQSVVEIESNTHHRVLHIFSSTVLGVRKAVASVRTIVIECAYI